MKVNNEDKTLTSTKELYILTTENVCDQYKMLGHYRVYKMYNKFLKKIIKDIDEEYSKLNFQNPQLDLYYSKILTKYKNLYEYLYEKLKEIN